MAEEQVTGSIGLSLDTGFPLLTVTGYFEGTTYAKLETIVDQLLGEGRCALIIDFSKCAALNSVAIGQFLFLATKVVEDFQGALLLTQVSPVMQRVFDLAGITGYAQVVATVAEATAQLQAR